jgi:hypothetical protein
LETPYGFGYVGTRCRFEMTRDPNLPKKPVTTHPAKPDHGLKLVDVDRSITKRFPKVLAALAKK